LARQRHLLLAAVAVWLRCEDLVKVTHFIPEAVVSAYNTQGGNPWSEMSMVSHYSRLESSITNALSGVSAGGGNNELKTPGNVKPTSTSSMPMLLVIRQRP